jgi:hypothetical protein
MIDTRGPSFNSSGVLCACLLLLSAFLADASAEADSTCKAGLHDRDGDGRRDADVEPEWLVPTALILGEVGWWVVLSLLAACGLTLKMQHYSRDEDWLPFMLAIAMMVGAPLLTLAISSAAWRVQRTVLGEGS